MTGQSLYDQRQALIDQVIRREPADRIPIIYWGHAFAARMAGLSMAEYCRNDDAAVEAELTVLDKLEGFEGCYVLPMGAIGLIQTTFWLSRVRIPGVDLPDDVQWQIEESGTMSEPDYDVIISKGWTEYVNAKLPTIVDLAAFGSKMQWLMSNLGVIMDKLKARGYVTLLGFRGGGVIPFELFCGGRTMQAFVTDLYRIPDKVQAAMDAIMPALLSDARIVTPGFPMRASIVGYRSASALVSPRLWDRFVYPYMEQMARACEEVGYTTVLLMEGNWTRDLARFRDLPLTNPVLYLDGMTDMRKARAAVGDKMALMGDVPGSLLAAGTPDEVYHHVRDLVRDIGSTGLILCAGVEVPGNTPVENVKAMLAAGRDFGSI